MKKSRIGSIKKYGKTYYLATLFFPRTIKQKIFLLYAFVRAADNIVDNANIVSADAMIALQAMQQDFHNAINQHNNTTTLSAEFATLVKRHTIPVAWVDTFFDAMIADCNKKQYNTYTELKQYMYGSAEVIGLMICKILDVSPDAYPYAKKLGEAMQYTNFLRDIQEDWQEYRRIYIPTDRLAPYNITHQELVHFCEGSPITSAWKQCIEDQITFIQQLYLEAEQGYSYLPEKGRLAVRLSALLYADILHKIQKNNYDVFSHTATTTHQERWSVLSRYATKQLSKYLLISRPRFWLYLLGPVLIGTTISIQGGSPRHWGYVLLFLFFSLPANLFLYGVNDIYDYETDSINQKKQEYEQLLEQQEHKLLKKSIFWFIVPFLMVLGMTLPIRSFVYVGVFMFLGWQYSAPPGRFKGRALIDSLSNILYIMPGLAAYAIGGSNISIYALLAACARSMSMHTYSAIPDIQADTDAGITTTANRLGKNGALLYCGLLWAGSIRLSSIILGRQIWFVGVIYIFTIIGSFFLDVFKIYKLFPYINALVGMILFFWIVWGL